MRNHVVRALNFCVCPIYLAQEGGAKKLVKKKQVLAYRRRLQAYMSALQKICGVRTVNISFLSIILQIPQARSASGNLVTLRVHFSNFVKTALNRGEKEAFTQISKLGGSTRNLRRIFPRRCGGGAFACCTGASVHRIVCTRRHATVSLVCMPVSCGLRT